MKLLHQLCEVAAPSGDEGPMTAFLLDYIDKNSKNWKVQPQVFSGEGFQDAIVLVFGQPRTAIYAHIDSIGFTVRYENQLVPIGGPRAETGYKLVGEDPLGLIECELIEENGNLFHNFSRAIQRGTSLTFKCDFRDSDDYVESCYLDNRLGVYNALKVCEDLEDGMICFSCWEEHGGGSVPVLAKFMYEKYQIKQALISDITWITDGVFPGEGVAISMRDRNVPRQEFVRKIIGLAEASKVAYQLEVEGGGSSDGRELQLSPYPIDWCFIGAAEEGVHSPNEKVHKKDIQDMILLYQYLMKHL